MLKKKKNLLIILYVNCFGRTMLYMCIYIYIIFRLIYMYRVSAQGIDENMINVHYYYDYCYNCIEFAHNLTPEKSRDRC